ncbi:hypothetical protein [Phaeodactylibacter sp.]|uniref:hypothetical protein n=1 Tax=Phaeodactylibacter sp. TaxID=1940289 RepID=UPI0025E2B446|nr:hypothetical protein [Phaeodactylibacter sp.]MCI4650840.1 hypothetical protein [Phaeodactylibacter sp.]MCI5089797.1 hypothetical protein [Phaeodactylibacter sp.]
MIIEILGFFIKREAIAAVTPIDDKLDTFSVFLAGGTIIVIGGTGDENIETLRKELLDKWMNR